MLVSFGNVILPFLMFQKACCHGKHMYVFAQCVVHELMERLEDNTQVSCMTRLSQQLAQGTLNKSVFIYTIIT